MSLYPSLEDMTVSKMAASQVQKQQSQRPQVTGATAPVMVTTGAHGVAVTSGLYPSLDDYMGLNLQHYTPPPQQAVVPAQTTAVTPVSSGPVSGVANVGIMRSAIKQGIREVTLCKDAKGKCGVSFHAESKGVFICFVQANSPAAMAGLRFGDQILQANGETVAGWSHDKMCKFIKKASADRIVFAVRDRPFERTITMQKDSSNHVGFAFRDGEIKTIVKDTSAARNGILIDHYLTEVNGQNVIGLKDKQIGDIFSESPRTITITIMPKFVYDHMMKNMGSKLKKQMDHSIPDV
jgi:syntenin-1